MNELGEKAVPSGNSVTSKAAVQFAGIGVNFLRSIPVVERDAESGKEVLNLSEAELIGKVCAGNLLFAQGLELLLKLALMAEGIPDKGFKQHALLDRFNKISSIAYIRSNIDIYMPQRSQSRMGAARSVVSQAESSFMVSRYIGLRKEDLISIDPLDASGLLMALVFSYRGMAQIEAAHLIGIDVKAHDGSPLIEQQIDLRNLN